MGYFSIRVLNSQGQPCKGAKVVADFGIWNGQTKGFTDHNGWVEFSNQGESILYATLYIDGKPFGEITTRSGKTYSFTL